MASFWQTFAAALFAAVLALAGNALLLYLQDRAKRREERRSLVYQLHSETVDMITDIDLLVRRLRASAILGEPHPSDHHPSKVIEDVWEGGLLRRIRRVEYGHPDPEVRAAAEAMESEMWVFITTAMDLKEDDVRPSWVRRSDEKRSEIVLSTDRALKELKQAVYMAIYRDGPKRAEWSSVAMMPSRLTRKFREKKEPGSLDSVLSCRIIDLVCSCSYT